jgi:YD repeat-containing protein
MPSTVQSAILGNSLQTDITFDAYDDKGNILQYTAKDGIVNSFIWGYNKQYPVAKIVGKSYSDAISGSGIVLNTVNAPSSDSLMRLELNKLRTLTGCFVSTYTYKPLVGVTSETDPNGKTIYYTYDKFNRLTLIRDRDNYVIKKFCYNYSGQPVDCGVGSLPTWQVVSSICEISSGNFTGNLILTERDMNPSSSTYNQTRAKTIVDARACFSCSGEDKKIISGVCETGTKVCLGDFRFHGGPWQHYYQYVWSDASTSEIYVGEGHGCL